MKTNKVYLSVISLIAAGLLLFAVHMYFYWEPSLAFLLLYFIGFVLLVLAIIAHNTMKKTNFSKGGAVVSAIVIVSPILPTAFDGNLSDPALLFGGILNSFAVVILVVANILIWRNEMIKIDRSLPQ